MSKKVGLKVVHFMSRYTFHFTSMHTHNDILVIDAISLHIAYKQYLKWWTTKGFSSKHARHMLSSLEVD